ncbi:MAG: hypothetical protein JSS53_04390, partial [Proteobacteria bacterium]|nr:hypothetical protein [Pseudomonadota bacterium]
SGQTENLNFSYIANDGVINSLSAVGSITEVASQTAGTGGTGGSSGTGATGTGATGGAVGTGATGPALPTVDILPGTDATESGTHGSFSVNLEGPALANDLTVNFVTSGTAVDGVAYSDIGTSVVILHGQTSANIDISPINLGIIGGSESITLSLASSQSYQVDSLLNQATISIIDDLAGTQTTTGSQAGATPGIAQKALAP